MKKIRIPAVVLMAGALVLSGCGGGESTGGATVTETVTVTASPEDSTPTSESADASDPVVEPTPEASTESASEFTSLKFGDSLPVASASGSSSIVTLGQPELAECQYSAIGCDEPEIGDRVVQIPILIENGRFDCRVESRSIYPRVRRRHSGRNE